VVAVIIMMRVVPGSAVNLTLRRELEESGFVRVDAPFIAKDLDA
jgi:hypothetical protein